jgi:DNA recombination protein RmuC
MTVALLSLSICALACLAVVLLIIRKSPHLDFTTLALRLDAFEKTGERTERMLRDELAQSREELGRAAREQRQETGQGFKALADTVIERMTEAAALEKEQHGAFLDQLTFFARASGERLDAARGEAAGGAKQLREEVIGTLKAVSDTITKVMGELASRQGTQLDIFSKQLGSFAQASGDRLDSARTESATTARELREELITTLNGITETMTRTMGEMSNAQKSQLEVMSSAITKLADASDRKLETIRHTVETKLESMHADNSKQLDQMRQTVDERLQGTLERRLSESFKQVSERLELVHKGLGEMQALATGVGDLKKVLTNVKTRGTWGEVQLGALLEQVLTPDQFDTNVATKDGGERVEFAIRLPGQGTHKDETVFLPIDAKFPLEDYQRLVEAQESGDLGAVEAAGRQLEARVKRCANDIAERYLNPPKSTDFGMLYLPTEGLFAEVIRRTGLAEVIQREYRVVIAGPTTLWSILSSLQMGFRKLAIQKRSSEVWNLLAAVKTEWMRYGGVLDAVQKKLHQASETIDKARVRSRAVGRTLREVQELPVSEAAAILPIDPKEGDVMASQEFIPARGEG